MYQNIPTKVLTGEVRLSYAHLTAPYANPAQPGAEAKYSVTLLIPKTDLSTKADIDASIEAAAQAAVNSKWGGFRPPQLRMVIHDGDGVRQDGSPYGEECKGCWVITASSKNKPQCIEFVDAGGKLVSRDLAPQDIYSGMYARVTVNFYGYSNSGNKGVACGLGNVMKTRDGEPLSGGASAASDFAGVGQAVSATPAYGGAMPATPGEVAYPNVGYTAQAGGYVAPAAPVPGYGAPVGAAQPMAGGIDPITGLPR